MFESCKCFVVKVTRDCNLRCKYCYVADKDKYKGEVMSFEVFKALVDRICLDKLKENNYQEFSFIFHGGEPTTIGYDNLNKFLHYAHSRFSKNHFKFNFGIQTNGTLLTPELLQLFHDFKFSIGMSFDGGISSSNTARTKKDIKEYLNTAIKCREVGINPGLLTVISKENISFSKKNFKWLYRHGWKNGKWNYVEDVLNNGNLEVLPEEYFQKVTLPFMKYILKNNGKKFQESNLINTIIQYFETRLKSPYSFTLDKQNAPGNCYIKFCGAGSRVMEISPDGEINYCGRYSKDDEVSNCGNIYNLDFLGTQSRKMYYRHIYVKHNLILQNHCDLCSAADICDYGCLAFYYVRNHKYGMKTDFICSYFKLLKDYIIKHEDELFDLYFNLQKNSNDILYIRSSSEVRSEQCQKLYSKVPTSKRYCYQIIPDPDFKSSDNKCYQYKILRTLKRKFFFKRKRK